MMPTEFHKWIIAVSFALAAGGYLIVFWPLSVLGILLAALADHGVVAVAIGFLLDLASGTPAGLLHYVYLPFTLLAVAAWLARRFGARFFFQKNSPDAL